MKKGVLIIGAFISISGGASFTSSSRVTASSYSTQVQDNIRFARFKGLSFPGRVEITPRVNVKIGQYGFPFVKKKIFQYFGWYIDLSYQRLTMPRQGGNFTRTRWIDGNPFVQEAGEAQLWGDGDLYTISIMASARYGFLPTPEHPLGIIQPYASVGPAILINRFEPSIQLTRLTWLNGNPVNIPLDQTHDWGSKTSVNVGIAAEAGVRYFPHSNFFLDLSYRYTSGSASFSFPRRNNSTVEVDYNINNHRVMLGVGYNF